MTFEELRLIKESLTNMLSHFTLDGVINHKINYLHAELKDKNFDFTQIEQMYYSMLNKNNEILKNIQSSIEDIDRQIITLGLEISVEHEHDNSFNEEKLLLAHQVTQTSPEVERTLEQIVKKYTGWQYPGLYFSSNSSNGRLDYMSGADPVYILGPTEEMLQSWICGYPELYRRRLKLYALNRHGFDNLPLGQFGFILCWDYFPLLTIGIVKSYLQKLTSLLRPGGVLLFNYTNAELYGVAGQVDHKVLPWASKSYIKKLINSLDFKIIETYDFYFEDTGNSTSWFLVEKIGELKTLRRSAVLGEIDSKPPIE